MTFGHKVQVQPGPDGPVAVPFDFNPFTCGQIVDNFARLNKARRLPLDYNHQAAEPDNKVVVQNLAYFSGLCVIAGQEAGKLWDHDPARVAPVPGQLRVELQRKYPRESDVDGLWIHCSEVTPLGVEVLPNVQDLSPWFFADDVDEQNEPIGYRLATVSAVPVAFQDKTTISLGKGARMDMPASAGHVPEPVKGKSTMAVDPKQDNGDDDKNKGEMRKAICAKLGLPESATDEHIMGAMHAKLGVLPEQTTPPDEDAEKKAKLAKEEEAKAAAAALAAEQGYEPPAGSSMAKLVSKQTAAMATLSKQVAEQRVQLDQIEKDKQETAKRTKAATFAKGMVDDGRWPAHDEAGLVELEAAGLGSQAVKPFAKGTFTLARQTFGGNPPGQAGTGASGGAASGSAWEQRTPRSVPVKGMALSKAAAALADKDKIDFGEAQLRVARENPHLYQ